MFLMTNYLFWEHELDNNSLKKTNLTERFVWATGFIILNFIKDTVCVYVTIIYIILYTVQLHLMILYQILPAALYFQKIVCGLSLLGVGVVFII